MNFIKNVDKLYLAIFLFIILYLLINIIKPSFIFNKQENCLRDFGVGYKNTSVLSLWIVSILLAIISYLIVIYIFHLQNKWF
jgi:hypothetical protein|tara:strand:- start:222 stop:467 length:246 start_codon:yes stop_codon:yes gene_type:complete